VAAAQHIQDTLEACLENSVVNAGTGLAERLLGAARRFCD